MLGILVGTLPATDQLRYPRTFTILGLAGVLAVAAISTRFDAFGIAPLQWYHSVVIAPMMAILLFLY